MIFCEIIGILGTIGSKLGTPKLACYPLVNIQKAMEMAIEIVDFPIKNGDFPLLC